jgi:hypothetical protein
MLYNFIYVYVVLFVSKIAPICYNLINKVITNRV